MRHQRNRHKLSLDSAHRKALLLNLSKQLIEHERIETTVSKAKAVKPEVEKLVTLARRGDLHARRQALLDVAAGNGNLALLAAEEGADVVASDLAPAQVDLGRARTQAAGVDVEWVVADAEE